jgi:hypothetical protein
MQNLSLKEIEQAIEEAGSDEQRQLLARLPKLIGLPAEDIALSRLSEPSFDFWSNCSPLCVGLTRAFGIERITRG